MENIKIRKAYENDLNKVLEIINEAKLIMKEMDIPQWQNPNYPTKDDLVLDIEKDSLYVMTLNDVIIGTTSIFVRKENDNEDNYHTIFDGEWLNDDSYVVIHRCAIKNENRGNNFIEKFFSKAKEIAIENNIKNLRIDTHEKNTSMRKAIDKYGFIYCGKVFMLDSTERYAYQLEMK